jgi:hypothetical protein
VKSYKNFINHQPSRIWSRATHIRHEMPDGLNSYKNHTFYTFYSFHHKRASGYDVYDTPNIFSTKHLITKWRQKLDMVISEHLYLAWGWNGFAFWVGVTTYSCYLVHFLRCNAFFLLSVLALLLRFRWILLETDCGGLTA